MRSRYSNLFPTNPATTWRLVDGVHLPVAAGDSLKMLLAHLVVTPWYPRLSEKLLCAWHGRA